MYSEFLSRFTKTVLLLSIAVFSFAMCDEPVEPVESIDCDGYTLIDLGAYSRHKAEVTGINDSGQVTGYSKNFLNKSKSYLWENGKVTDLGSLGGGQTWARGINNAGHIVGSSRDSKQHVAAFLRKDGQMTNLGTLGGEYQNYKNAQALNNVGQVAGYELVTVQDQHGFLWEDGSMTDLGIPYEDNFDNISPRAINDSGLIVGETNDNGLDYGFTWTAEDGYTSLGMGIASDVNNSGRVVGRTCVDGGNINTPKFAYYWENRGALKYELERAEGEEGSTAQGINDSGTIVGSFAFRIEGKLVSYAFIYENGQKENLQDILPANSGWALTDAIDINIKGEIIGKGTLDGEEHSFLLRPKN
ncbi:MAG: DUF3466 family protein [bacterium]|nr:DUF3466 family protein [bacterium]